MESLQNLKRRQKGVESIGKITKAMELVAATKMRRSQEIALASRPYAISALELLANLSRLGEMKLPPILAKRPVKHTAIVVVTSDKGLAGSFNSAVIRTFQKFMRENKGKITKEQDHFIAVGQKAASFLERNIKLCDKFVRFGDYTTIEEIKPLANHLVKGYLSQEWDRVIVFSTHFRTALKQEVLMRKIFPVDFEALKETAQEIIPQTGRFAEFRKAATSSHEASLSPRSDRVGAGAPSGRDYLFEPSPAALLEALVPHLVEMQIYHLVLEANASEHAARRVAMKSASDNASELSSELSLVYNKARQAGITKELTEISAGAEALT